MISGEHILFGALTLLASAALFPAIAQTEIPSDEIVSLHSKAKSSSPLCSGYPAAHPPEWWNCLNHAALGIYDQPESANTLADAAFEMCRTEQMRFQKGLGGKSCVEETKVWKDKIFRPRLLAAIIAARAALAHKPMGLQNTPRPAIDYNRM